MWRRSYLLLLLLRIYFALSPSYLHPDEVFQGPEVIAGELFGYQSVRTWEWTVANPIRSVFPLWPVYGLPMALLKALWSRDGDFVSPTTIYYTTRFVMFAMCFVLEDWAIHELVQTQRKFKNAVMLVASSYVTWTFQTHTFSNSVETLLVLWCLVLMQRISDQAPTIDEKPQSAGPQNLSITSGLVLGFLLVLGLFNRITFPAFLLIPGIQLLPCLLNRPIALIAILVSATFWLFVAIATDTAFYHPQASTSFRALFQAIHTSPVITPLNNLLYNSKASNLKAHGLHPHYQHILVNLPQLLGPALTLLFTHNLSKNILNNPRLTSAITGITILSVIPHQEPRFLLPAIPLVLTCIRLPSGEWRKYFWTIWGVFNVAMGILMGTVHQAGVIPAQLGMPDTIRTSLAATQSTARDIHVYWWKTYPPSLYMLGPPATNPINDHRLTITTTPLLGANMSVLSGALAEHLPQCNEGYFKMMQNILSEDSHVLLAAPFSAWRGDVAVQSDDGRLALTQVQSYRRHLNLDDMDFGDDGVWDTLSRVIGKAGLGVWRVERDCSER